MQLDVHQHIPGVLCKLSVAKRYITWVGRGSSGTPQDNHIFYVIYCITCTLCKKIYIGETGRRRADCFREHLRDAEQNNTDASKPVARHFNLLNHSHHNMTICGLSLHHGNTESRKNLEQKFIFQLGPLSPHGINERLSFHYFIHKFM